MLCSLARVVGVIVPDMCPNLWRGPLPHSVQLYSPPRVLNTQTKHSFYHQHFFIILCYLCHIGRQLRPLISLNFLVSNYNWTPLSAALIKYCIVLRVNNQCPVLAGSNHIVREWKWKYNSETFAEKSWRSTQISGTLQCCNCNLLVG